MFFCFMLNSSFFLFGRDESTLYTHLTPMESDNLREASESTPESASTSDASNGEEHVTNVVGDRVDAYTRAQSASGEEDEEELALRRTVRAAWSGIKSFYKCHRVLDVLNVRVWDPSDSQFKGDAAEALRRAWRAGLWKLKINAAAGCILQNKETGEFRYFHSSCNNGSLFERPLAVNSSAQLETFLDKVMAEDFLEAASQQRPDTRWRLHALTNITFYMYKMNGVFRTGGAAGSPAFAGVECPSFLRQNKHVVGLFKDRRTGKPYADRLCFFRCLSLLVDCECAGRCRCLIPRELTVRRLFKEFLDHRQLEPTEFAGVNETDLVGLETLFGVSVTVFAMNADGVCSVVWNSRRKFARPLNLHLYANHFSYIKDIDAFCGNFQCENCEAQFTRAQSCRRHTCKIGDLTEFALQGGMFRAPSDLSDELEIVTDVPTPESIRFHPYRATFDIEVYLPAENLPTNTPKMTFEHEHRLLSISVCSNVPNYTVPLCIVVDGRGASACVERFVSYLSEIADESERLLVKDNSVYLDHLKSCIVDREKLEKKFESSRLSNARTYGQRANFQDILGRLHRYLATLPVVGFNSQRYDLNVMKGALMKQLFGADVANANSSFIVKKQDALTCVQTDQFRFLDITNFMAPGCNYAAYLKAYGVQEEKGFFPYEWLDSLEKLDHPRLPPHEAFYSKLKLSNISEEDYATVEAAWKRHNMQTVRDLLVWYNNLDVKPFLTALERQVEIYRQKGIAMLTQAISLPGLAVHWMFKTLGARPNLRQAYTRRVKQGFVDREALSRAVVDTRCLQLVEPQNSELYQLFRDNLVGGPSLVFHRYHEAGATLLRPAEGGTKTCGKILGVDANALYLFCIMQDMPVGRPRVRLAEDNFKMETVRGISKTAQGWLAWEEFDKDVTIETGVSEGERRLGRHNLPVDGFCASTNTVYQFNGCYWHGHGCDRQSSVHIADRSAEERRKETQIKKDYLEHLGYEVVAVWECEWRARVDVSPGIKEFLKVFFQHTFGVDRTFSHDEILTAVLNGKFFGFVECDLHVPDSLVSKFSEMPPIFKNVSLDRSHLSDHMREFAESEGHLSRPQRCLIGSMRGEKILLLSELLKWYLEQGLTVSRIYRLVEFERAPILKPFGESVTEARRAGDSDASKQLLASTAKLVGNSLYGKTIVDKTKHRNVRYTTDESKASRLVGSARFHSLNVLDEDVFETLSFKKKVGHSHHFFVIFQIAF